MRDACFSLVSADSLEGPTTKPKTAAVQYAALFWIPHVIPELYREDFRLSIENFFKEILLNWIELGGSRNNLGMYMLSLSQLRLALEKTRKLLGQVIVSWDFNFTGCFYVLTRARAR